MTPRRSPVWPESWPRPKPFRASRNRRAPSWRLALGGAGWQPTCDAAANSSSTPCFPHGGGPGDRVALLMRQDAPLIAAALAVLKTGRVVVVLNPTDPHERLKKVLADSAPHLIVTDSANQNLAGQLAEEHHAILSFEEQEKHSTSSPEIKIDPAAAAWLLYTSGSTGQPKGVIQTHRNIVHNMLRHDRGMNVRADDRIILLNSPSGGQGLATTWCALLNGATLYPFPTAEKRSHRTQRMDDPPQNHHLCSNT